MKIDSLLILLFLISCSNVNQVNNNNKTSNTVETRNAEIARKNDSIQSLKMTRGVIIKTPLVDFFSEYINQFRKLVVFGYVKDSVYYYSLTEDKDIPDACSGESLIINEKYNYICYSGKECGDSGSEFSRQIIKDKDKKVYVIFWNQVIDGGQVISSDFQIYRKMKDSLFNITSELPINKYDFFNDSIKNEAISLNALLEFNPRYKPKDKKLILGLNLTKINPDYFERLNDITIISKLSNGNLEGLKKKLIRLNDNLVFQEFELEVNNNFNWILKKKIKNNR
jgi:hypothetical protein